MAEDESVVEQAAAIADDAFASMSDDHPERYFESTIGICCKAAALLLAKYEHTHAHLGVTHMEDGKLVFGLVFSGPRPCTASDSGAHWLSFSNENEFETLSLGKAVLDEAYGGELDVRDSLVDALSEDGDNEDEE